MFNAYALLYLDWCSSTNSKLFEIYNFTIGSTFYPKFVIFTAELCYLFAN